MHKQEFDIAIIGGGLAGLTQSILLAKQGWMVVCIDREAVQTQTLKSYDIRTTAISWGSRNLLLNAGIWQNVESSTQPITNILIKDEDNPKPLIFDASEVEGDAFGWIIDNRDLRIELLSQVNEHDNITHLTQQTVSEFEHKEGHVQIKTQDGTTLTARLVIGADGRNSFTREAMNIGTWTKDYKQNAIVTMVTHDKPHNGVALEHFRAQGPFAVLPYVNDTNGKHQSAIVWTVDRTSSNQWLDCDETVFMTALQERASDTFGTITSCGPRAAWPLSMNKAYSYIAPRMCLIAEAAHGMHPIAGQGLNMSLRDIAALTDILGGMTDPGDITALKQYQKQRRGDNLGMVLATDTLNELFGHNHSIIRAARRFGLSAVSNIKPIKQFFMKQAMGALGHLPALVREHQR